MEFDEYLRQKKIDPKKFKKGDSELYLKFSELFKKVHPNSFTQQKLILNNKIRREFLLESKEEKSPKPSPVKVKPKILPKKPKI